MAESLRRKRWRQQHGLCWICLWPMTEGRGSHWSATWDHIQPLGRTGANRPGNKLLAHQICNSVRGCPKPKTKLRIVISRAFSRIGEAAKRRHSTVSGDL